MRFIVLVCVLFLPLSITAASEDFYLDDYITRQQDGKSSCEIREFSLDLDQLQEILSDLPPDIREIKFINNGITADSVPLIIKFLKKNFIQRFTLAQNLIRDEGAKLFAEFLQDDPSLIHLSLAYNGITNKGFDHLYSGIHGHQSLQVLDLRGNALSKGCGAFFRNSANLHACNISKLILNDNRCIRADKRAFMQAAVFLKEKHGRSLTITFEPEAPSMSSKKKREQEVTQKTFKKYKKNS